MKLFSRRRFLRQPATLAPAVLAFIAGLASAAILAGCGSSSPSESESKMTSYSANESKNDTASLFTVPQDQMAHLQVTTVEKSRLPRVLRLTGAVAYNAFATTPVFSAIGGPVQKILTIHDLIHLRYPRLFGRALDVSQIQKCVSAGRQKLSALQGSLRA